MGVTYEYTPAGIVEKYTSHEGVVHDSIDGLAYDWEQIGDPGIEPRYPFKVYLPRSTGDVVRAIQETRTLRQAMRIRGAGHSSNDLVLPDEGGSVLSTAKLNRIIDLDEEAGTVTVQAGVITAELDEYLLTRGYGLPVLGDHNDITVGGFVSAGGIGPGSHRYGMFVDNVIALEYVDFSGAVRTCSKSHNGDEFYSLLAGTGQYGVIVSLVCRVIRIDKYGTILRNDIRHFRDSERFVAATQSYLNDFGSALMGRGAWFDLPLGRRYVTLGQMSAYTETRQTRWKTLRNRIVYAALHAIGKWAGRAPKPVEKLLKLLGLLGLLFSPRYASIKNIESFTDRITDSTVGDPTRWFILLVPASVYSVVYRSLYELARSYRTQRGCFTFIALYVKGIRSAYLAKDLGDVHFCELTLYVGVNRAAMDADTLRALVSAIDDLCIAHGAYRYMHTKTVTDAERRRRIDPNASYGERLAGANGRLAYAPTDRLDGRDPSTPREGSRV